MVLFEREGREGKDEEEEDVVVVVVLVVQCGGLDVVWGVGPPRRVLFLRRRTRLECFCVGARVLGNAGFVVAALAQPLELDVAPCMPLRPGRLG